MRIGIVNPDEEIALLVSINPGKYTRIDFLCMKVPALLRVAVHIIIESFIESKLG